MKNYPKSSREKKKKHCASTRKIKTKFTIVNKIERKTQRLDCGCYRMSLKTRKANSINRRLAELI